jgi:anti-anti-sigma factor
MADDRILFAIHDRTCFIKMLGEAKYSTTTGFGTFINDLFARCDFDNILVDLSETSYIDSTNLGELTKLSSFLMQHRQRRPMLISTRANISAVIASLGMDRIFVVVDETPDLPSSMEVVPGTVMTVRENAFRILEAHRYLVSLNEKTGREFRSVVDAFEQNLGVEPDADNS